MVFVTNKKNYEKITKSDYLIFSNNRMACSAIPMIILAKIFKKSSKSLSFVMGGFFREIQDTNFSNFFQNLYIILTLKILISLFFKPRVSLNTQSNYPKFNKNPPPAFCSRFGMESK